MLKSPTHLPAGRAAVMALAVTLAMLRLSPAAASPPDTAWIEDIHLHPPGPAELHFVYDYQETEIADVPFERHLAVVRTAVGFDRAPLDLSPSLGFVQSADVARLDHLGLRFRYRLAGTPGTPVAAAFVGYRFHTADDNFHLLEQGVAGRWEVNRSLAVSGELSVRENLGLAVEDQVELRAGAAVTYGVVLNLIRLGAESLVVVPLKGERIFEPGFNGDGEDIAVYAGPSLRLHFEYLWLGLGAMTGKVTGTGAPLLVRAVLGTPF